MFGKVLKFSARNIHDFLQTKRHPCHHCDFIPKPKWPKLFILPLFDCQKLHVSSTNSTNTVVVVQNSAPWKHFHSNFEFISNRSARGINTNLHFESEEKVAWPLAGRKKIAASVILMPRIKATYSFFIKIDVAQVAFLRHFEMEWPHGHKRDKNFSYGHSMLQ